MTGEHGSVSSACSHAMPPALFLSVCVCVSVYACTQAQALMQIDRETARDRGRREGEKQNRTFADCV